ncbi:hypothetical protein COJ48_22760 [Bacillus cereus]|nr:hypothetical protein COJ48_22760 [Bacillus cereus]PGP77077.1 hypothetical protein CN997_22860 [Bacillus cereus]
MKLYERFLKYIYRNLQYINDSTILLAIKIREGCPKKIHFEQPSLFPFTINWESFYALSPVQKRMLV